MVQNFFQKIFGSIFIVSIFVTGSVFASNIRISEVHPTEEYIELENIFHQDIDLTGWKFSELSGSKEKLYDIEFLEENFSAGGFFVIDLSKKINDSGDTVAIYNAIGEKIDEVVVPKKQSGKSWSLVNEVFDWQSATKGAQNFVENDAPSPTPTPTSTPISDPTPTPISISTDPVDSTFTPTDINSPDVSGLQTPELSEILPNPAGTDGNNEFIELYNPNEEKFYLENFILEDAGEKKFIFDDTVILQPKSYTAFYKNITAITINNTAEKIFLFDPTGKKISELQFTTSAKDNYTFTPQGWTETMTPNAANIVSVVNSANISDTRDEKWLFAERFFTLKNPRKNSPQLLITKISANSSADYIDVLCVRCDMDIEGIRLGIDGEAYRIPEKIFAHTGDILRFQFEKDTTRNPLKTSTGWVFFVPISGLTTTDESVYIGDEKGKILDALCYANMNTSFVGREKDDVGNLMSLGAWKEKFFAEAACIDVSVWGRNWLLMRKGAPHMDTDRKTDFFLSSGDKKFGDTKNFSLQISKIILESENTRVEIKNTGAFDIDLSQIFIANRNKFLIFLSEEEKFLAPQNIVTIHLPVKKFSRQDAALSLRNFENTILESFCITPKKYAGKYVQRYNHFKKWEGKCLQWSRKDMNIATVLQRKNFEEVSSVKNFIRSNERIAEFPPIAALNTNPEEAEKVPLVEGDLGGVGSQTPKKNYTLAITPHKSFLKISGQIFDRPKTIIISIPKANIKKKIKLTSTGKFSTEFKQPFKKGRYSMKISYQHPETKKRIYLPEKFLLPEKIFADELSQIVISKILPNPEGKDSGQEIFALKNISKNSGWIRNWKLDQGRKTAKTLPHIFIEPGEEIFLPKKYFSTLKNSSGTAQIIDASGKTVEKISWEKAREGEYFGANAPKYFPKKKKTKKKNKKKSQKKIDIVGAPIYRAPDSNHTDTSDLQDADTPQKSPPQWFTDLAISSQYIGGGGMDPQDEKNFFMRNEIILSIVVFLFGVLAVGGGVWGLRKTN